MFKLPDGIPSLSSSGQDWADYAEYLAWQKEGVSVSLLNVVKVPLLVSDEVDVEGVEDDTDRFTNKVDEIAEEIRYRSKICEGQYPFKLVNQDYGISYLSGGQSSNLIYRYLLMSTRVNMSQKRIHADIDGALLFERLSAVVAKSFFGDNSEVDVLGTSKTEAGGFRRKLKNLVDKMREGGDIHPNDGHKPQDENVDIVVWKGFSDQQPSQMIAFGQCKTGTSWSNKLSELNTDAFCRTWFTQQPVLTPIRLFFCAQYFPRNIWRVRANEAGLVFDRFRIIDYLPKNIDENLLRDIESWTIAAFNAYRKGESTL